VSVGAGARTIARKVDTSGKSPATLATSQNPQARAGNPVAGFLVERGCHIRDLVPPHFPGHL
jgi:hypothetical protein